VTPAALVTALEEAGVRLRVVGGRLDLEAATEPPRPLLDELARNRDAVLRYLAAREIPPPVVAVRDRREETAAPASDPPEPPQIASVRDVTAAEVLAVSGTLPSPLPPPPSWASPAMRATLAAANARGVLAGAVLRGESLDPWAAGFSSRQARENYYVNLCRSLLTVRFR
jgi:hypothetical protein